MSYFSKSAAAAAILALTFLAGCGDFEWFPKVSVFTNNSTAAATGTKPGTVMKELPFPTAVSIRSVSDIAFDKSSQSFWLLAETSSAPADSPNILVQINASDGSYKSNAVGAFWPFDVHNGSNLAYFGGFFWITASGVSGGKVYQVLSTGIYSNSFYNCPAATAGFCQGLAFDPATSSYWSAGSDNTNLVNYSLANGSVLSEKTYSNLWSTNGVSDVAFDSATNEVFVVKDGIIRINKNNGINFGSIPFTLPGSGRGDWDGSFFWVVDNTSRSLKALFVR